MVVAMVLVPFCTATVVVVVVVLGLASCDWRAEAPLNTLARLARGARCSSRSKSMTACRWMAENEALPCCWAARELRALRVRVMFVSVPLRGLLVTRMTLRMLPSVVAVVDVAVADLGIAGGGLGLALLLQLLLHLEGVV